MSPETGKKDSLLLDFGNALSELGPVDAVTVSRKKGRYELSAVPGRTCPNCRRVNHPSVRACVECCFLFPPPPISHGATATEAPVLSEPKWYGVRHVSYLRHEKDDKPPSLKVVYQIGDVWKVSDWWGLENPKWFPRNKAENSWKAAARKEYQDPPATVAAALVLIHRGGLKKVRRVLVGKQNGWDRVLEVEYESAEPTIAA